MSSIHKKIKQILKKDFGIKEYDIPVNSDLVSGCQLCEWELEFLYLKIEQAFKIEMEEYLPRDNINVTGLAQAVTENLAKINTILQR